jgi:hypothetical protein
MIIAPCSMATGISGVCQERGSMRAPHFLQLARIDEQHFIMACRHGLVHVTWDRTTIRFSRDEFRRLAGLLERAMDDLPPTLARDGRYEVTRRLDEDCELRMESLVVLLSPNQFEEFARATREAVRRLDEILSSGVWDRQEEDESLPSLLDQLRRFSFSDN